MSVLLSQHPSTGHALSLPSEEGTAEAPWAEVAYAKLHTEQTGAQPMLQTTASHFCVFVFALGSSLYRLKYLTLSDDDVSRHRSTCPWTSSPSATGDVLADPVTGATSPGLHGCPSLSHFTRPSPLTALPPALIVSCSLGLF